MSGHSKWAQIKRSKGAKDAKRGVLFSKLSNKITVAAKAGGSADPSMNFQLRGEIDNAKAVGLPNENIERAIKKAFDKNAAAISEVTYEGYGPFGTAFIVEVVTDSTNRSVQNIKHMFSKAGGSLGAMGSVAWMFETRGQLLIERVVDNQNLQLATYNLADIELVAIDAGAIDVEESEEGLIIYTQPQDLQKIKTAIENAGGKIAGSDIIKYSNQKVSLTEEQKEKVSALLETLEDYEDVVSVHTNAEI